MNYQGSNYSILENRKTSTGELNSVFGNTMSNSLRVNYSSSDESRPQDFTLFPFVDILQGGTAYISFGAEPFTPNNELRYNQFEVKNDFTKFTTKHELTVGGRVERYNSDNVFFNCCKQGAWVYNTPRRLLRGRARSARQPEPHELVGIGAQLPAALHEHPRPRQAEPAAALDSMAACMRRTCGVPAAT